LAIIAVYDHNDLSALFHYCLSIETNDSFQTGLANLSIFFKKNSKAIRDLEEKVSASRIAQRDMKSKLFYAKFIRLHGILFQAVIRAQNTESPSPEKDVETDIASLQEFGELLPSVLENMSNLIVNSLVGESNMLRMMAVCIFSAQRCIYGAGSFDGSVRTTAASYSLVLAFSIINRYVYAFPCDAAIYGKFAGLHCLLISIPN
jgi:hypothetical protein